MAHFILKEEHGKGVEPVGHVSIKHPAFSKKDEYQVTNDVDAHLGATVLTWGTKEKCNRFIDWLIAQLSSGIQIIDLRLWKETED